ncbi:MAG: glycosyltransferase, group [Candidatus Eremiobacteraeota bacterium]|nr:glycosyltransferase, group [Candidatus Eremiobacteraeota bacterium]
MSETGRLTMQAYRFPALDHLLAMTDDVGILQHATLDVPNRSCGYCTDDVGRALIVACEAASRFPQDRNVSRLVSTYLAYLHDAQLPNGWFHNFMGYDRRWQDHGGTPDAVGRAIWGLGYAERFAPRESWRALAGELRLRALPDVAQMEYVRSRAYAALGLVQSLATRPDDEFTVRAVLDDAAGAIADAYDAHRAPGWAWCEDVMTYDNARLPEALLRAGQALGEDRYTAAGLAMLGFYVDAVIEGQTSGSGKALFQPVGSNGWYPRGGTKARFGQQPLEAAALVDAALVAHDLTGNAEWRDIAEIAHAWYGGANVLGIPLAIEGGCRDGLDPTGCNPNQGAESTLSYLMSAIALANRSTTSLSLSVAK